MRRIAVALAAGFLVAPVLAAGDAVPDSGPGRFRLTPADTGFTRLDTTTGAITHCDEKAGRWFCNPLIEADGPIATRIDALSDQVARLAAAVSAMPDLSPVVARVDGLAGEVAALTAHLDVASAPSLALSPSVGPAADPAQGVVAAAVERLLAMVAILKHGPETTPDA